jgi:thioredoxin reductase
MNTENMNAGNMDPEKGYDVVVVGGGAAGLSGALVLSRARRSVLVVDAGRPRNAPAEHAHNYLGREGVSPLELLAIGRAEVAGYGAEVVTGTVASARRVGEDPVSFAVELDDGTVHRARRLLVTTGLVDELPDVPGLAERFGRDVLHCPYCHGWEVRDEPIGVLATGPLWPHQAQMWRQLSADVTVFLHTAPEPTGEEREQMAALGIPLVDGEVEGLEIDGDRLAGVRIKGGRVVARKALVVGPRMVARSGLLAGLGLRTEDRVIGGTPVGEYVPSEQGGATAVPGVYVAGNVTDVTATLIGAAGAGVQAAVALNTDLIAEDVRDAVRAHRARRNEKGEAR